MLVGFGAEIETETDAPLRIQIASDQQVRAAPQSLKIGQVERAPFDRRRSGLGRQEPGRTILLVDWDRGERQPEHRDVSDAEKRVVDAGPMIHPNARALRGKAPLRNFLLA